ncbi:MAG: DUF4199 domain-containing protein [Acidobacteria bacterium]|nr:DUF4199 domain-containing protein [Acidobacteriota bacterium]MBV9478755.1 DUF4199 domain-containing protein [Acidobacteriota bacterium]
MKRIVLIFGLISGVISSGLMCITMPLAHKDIINNDTGLVIGYTAIVLSLLLVFFGIRTYRDNHGGTITFGRGFAVGILITLISCVFYVATWEVIYFNFMPDFVERYTASQVKDMQRAGATEAQIAAKRAEMARMKATLDNPVTNAAAVFIEPFPVGLVITLVSAAILRRRSPSPGATVTATA